MHLLKFPTEVRLGSEAQFRCRCFGGVALRNKLLSQAALQIPDPSAWRALKVFLKNALKVALGDGAHCGHPAHVKFRLPC